MTYFCTIFDSNYLSRGLTMYHSLIKNCPDFKLFIVCLDQKLYDLLLKNNYQHIEPIKLNDIEKKYPELLVAKDNRTYVEYIFTLSPVLALYIIECYNYIDIITTLDADLYFYSDPTSLIKSYNFSIAITPHNFKNSLKSWKKYGHYNVSFQSFRNDVVGVKCLTDWKNNCINWCYCKNEKERYADQKYLNYWKANYDNVFEYPLNTGLSPWNIKEKYLSIDNQNNVLYKNEKIVYFHFHGVRNITNNLISIGLNEYQVLRRKRIINYIYQLYLKQLNRVTTENNLISNRIKRGMPLGFSKVIYIIFMADLYHIEKNKLIRILNLSIVRYLYSYLKSIIGTIKEK